VTIQTVRCYPFNSTLGTGPFSASRWRINVSAVQGSVSDWIRFREVEFRDVAGGTDLTGSGTATASASNGAEPPANAFDNNTATNWASGTGTDPQWLEYDFGTAVAPAELSINILQLVSGPTDFTIEYHDGANWQIASTIVAFRWHTASSAQTFPIGTTLTAAQADHWRIKETLKQNAGSFSAWAELQFQQVGGGSDLSDSTKAFATASGGSNPPSLGFDNSTATKWSNGTTATGHSIGCQISTPTAIERVVATSSSTANDSVKGFDVQYFNGQAWTTHWSVSTTNWAATETRTFDKP
jgi:hypothetical protein